LVLVDTSVWIDFFRGTGSREHRILHDLVEEEEDLCIANIILAEILQGIRSDKEFKQLKNYLLQFPIFSLRDVVSYIEAAQIYRVCRKKGLTIRRPLDCLIARIAIENDLVLLHKDKDFDTIAKASRQLQIYAP
jgi:predicted nucleic acid-binding protein